MKFATLEYEEHEYELVTVPVDYETTDWWLVDENGNLIKADQYDCTEDEVTYYFDFWEVRDLLPKEEVRDYMAELADYYYMLEQDKWL